MKREVWEFIKFHVMLGIKLWLRLSVALFVGPVRYGLAQHEWMKAEMAAFDARQLKMRESANSRETYVSD